MNENLRRASSRLFALSLAAFPLAACSSNPGPGMVPDLPARIASGDAPIRRGDCAEARRRVAEKANAYVDRLPSPKRMVPSPLPSKTMPTAVRRAKYNAVKITVLVDTLGRADMKTFTVVQSTHPWLAQSVRKAVAKWQFTPAELAGCRVARTFEWSATSGRRG